MTLSTMRDSSRQQAPDPTTTQINEAGHPGFDMFTQALTGVRRLDAQHGRSPDLHSEQLSACLAVKAWSAGLHCIDHVALGTDASRIFVAQGELTSPSKRIASVETMEAFNTPIAQSTQAWHVATQERAEQTLLRSPQPELQRSQEVQPQVQPRAL